MSWGSAGTILGWILWDSWFGKDEAAKSLFENTVLHNNSSTIMEEGSSVSSLASYNSNVMGASERTPSGLGLSLSTTNLHSRQLHSRNLSTTSLPSASSVPSPITTGHPTGSSHFANYSYYPPYNAPASPFSLRNQQRLATAKSAILIYCALLGLSPILKSLTKSTTSDSIWAISCWLMGINVFFFDYGGGVGVKYGPPIL